MGQQVSAIRLGAWGAIALSAALAGCANSYSKFYRPAEGAPAPLITDAAAQPLVERAAPAAEPHQLVDAYEKRGYVLIGSSAFNSDRRESEANAIAQGRKVGADLVVILNPRHTGSTTQPVALKPPASDSNRPMTSFGSHPVPLTRENSMTNTSGAQTTYVSMTVHHMDFGASYFIKQR